MLSHLHLLIQKVDLTKWGLAEIHSPKMLWSSDSPIAKLDLTKWGLAKSSCQTLRERADQGDKVVATIFAAGLLKSKSTRGRDPESETFSPARLLVI